ncbi:PHB depolymerase family esterase [Roseomonas sp. NAR14]|uniref:PHB depolymerase family esterase n=1 Tax=Roseomonas acroporae TaxID=2937791 RepID=A0A9X1YAA7_9PROT|nr:PHB depolymerase family esterase [Roseomonas acroporae]MCK8787039.1 PHB depolymerase family esterase [Roseomonas acroporae]
MSNPSHRQAPDGIAARLAAATEILRQRLGGASPSASPGASPGASPNPSPGASPGASSRAGGTTTPDEPATDGPAWLRYVPGELRGLVRSVLPDTPWTTGSGAASAGQGPMGQAGSGQVSSGQVSSGQASWTRFVPAELRERLFPDPASPRQAPPDPPPPRPHAQPQPRPAAAPRPGAEDRPAAGRFLAGTYANAAGSRPYRLYLPSGHAPGRRLPLVVMLHGCTQSPEDFARGTGMNDAAERDGFLVLYPGQPASAQPQRCWKWYSAADQRRDQGEPAIIAGMTRQVMRDHDVDPHRVYVAGLSAGGAKAAIMAEAYPDLYAAAGVHSGLACGAAQDLASAMLAMRQGAGTRLRDRPGGPDATDRLVPTIVFHGDRDGTVSARNGDDVLAQATRGAVLRERTERGEAPGGRAWSRTTLADASGRSVAEQWVIHGAGHAWSGGRPEGSFTDPRGPDATREMLRFFAEHPHPAPLAGPVAAA